MTELTARELFYSWKDVKDGVASCSSFVFPVNIQEIRP